MDANGNGLQFPARYGQNEHELALGRANWTFAGSPRGARAAATMYSLLGTARLNGFEPYAWLKDTLEKLPSYPVNRVHELLPLAR
ncbi:IS66 C-terminal element [Caballeronia arationis]|uniref:IS66 C-terminal element n=1 Tax=Caballeronia arationis TaxID=1777142 RepID=A0A7Z7I2U8_9BURK|nr:IS66 C-terminal element [Caballeronia arationis]